MPHRDRSPQHGCGNDALLEITERYPQGLEISPRTRDFHVPTSHYCLNSLRTNKTTAGTLRVPR
jgi:hypothetical protein